MIVGGRNSVKIPNIFRKPLSIVIEDENEQAHVKTLQEITEIEEDECEIQKPYINEKKISG